MKIGNDMYLDVRIHAGDYFVNRVQDSGTYEVIKLPDHIEDGIL